MAIVVSFKSFFGLSLEVNASEGKIILKQNGVFCRSWQKNQKDIKSICRDLRLDAGEDRKEVTGWVIVSLLRGETINYVNAGDKMEMATQEIGNILADLRAEALRKHPIRTFFMQPII